MTKTDETYEWGGRSIDMAFLLWETLALTYWSDYILAISEGLLLDSGKLQTN